MRTLFFMALASALLAQATPAQAQAQAVDWTPYEEDWVVEIITLDPDGERRETKIWIVVLDGAAYVRTNESRWLANIQRLPEVLLRTRDVEQPLLAEIDDGMDVYDRVEAAFKEKYGLLQKIMSAMRIGRPTVIRLLPRASE